MKRNVILDASAAETDDEPPSPSTSDLKDKLVSAISNLRSLQERDGDFSIDFGVKGGEINETSRAPQTVDYYAISKDVGDAAKEVVEIANQLAAISPTEEPTQYLGDKVNGDKAPLDGPWKLLFTTAADASFSKNSTRGMARVQNVVNAKKGRITNVIDFEPKADGSLPPLKQLNVVIKAKAEDKKRVGLVFKYAKAVLNKRIFGRHIALYIPVPAPFITRLIVLLSRIFKFGRGGQKKVPKASFDVVYLDEFLRIHRTMDNNLFVQGKEKWAAAVPFFR
uniref:Plastid lipid-associated protein/fibrillin conserved domain-containing protein n=1 Tax=Ditylum brightwellii TaxID=49249 RepID=A0A7S4T083_9STRA